MAREHPHRGDHQEGAEHVEQRLEPVEQPDAGGDAERPQHQRAEHPVEQHPRPVRHRHREAGEDEGPHEDVVDRQALLEQVGGVVLAGHRRAEPAPHHQPEGQAHRDPGRALDQRLAQGRGMRPPLDDQQLHQQQADDDREERRPLPGGDVGGHGVGRRPLSRRARPAPPPTGRSAPGRASTTRSRGRRRRRCRSTRGRRRARRRRPSLRSGLTARPRSAPSRTSSPTPSASIVSNGLRASRPSSR